MTLTAELLSYELCPSSLMVYHIRLLNLSVSLTTTDDFSFLSLHKVHNIQYIKELKHILHHVFLAFTK